MELNIVSSQHFGSGGAIIKNGIKYVPLKDYKGKLMNLSSEDSKIIEELKRKISEYEFRHYSMSKYLSNAKRVTRRQLMTLDELFMDLQSLRAQVRDIKIQSLKAQI